MSRAVDPETGLTAKQEAFCLELARTGNASEAYRKAYDAKGMKTETVNRKAAELAANGKVTARMAALRSEVRRRGILTLEEHMKALGVLRNKAVEARQYSAAISAEIARGKVSGLYVDGAGDQDEAPVRSVEIRIVDGRKSA